MAKLEDTTLESIIPENLLTFKEIADICKVLKLPIADVTGNIYYDAIMANFDIMPEDVIDLLGWQWHVDFYDSGADLNTKRTLVKQSLDWHRHKGTQYAVDSVLKTIAPKYYSQNWYEYDGKPYYFRIIETDADTVDYNDKEMITAVNSVKNVRSWLDGIVMDVTQDKSNDYTGYPGGKHHLNAEADVATEQGFWLDTTYINQYWKGYHVSDGSGQQLTGYWRLAGNTRLNGLFNRHLHEWLGETRFDGKEWQDIRGNNQKHKAEILKTVAAEQLGRKAGYRLNSTWQLNNWLQLDWPRSYVQEHDIQIAKVLDGSQLEQHKHGANATGIVEARQTGQSAGYKLNGKYRLNNVLRLQWPRRSMHRHNVEISKIVAAEQSGNKTGYRLNSTHQLNNTLRLEWPKRSMQIHQAESTNRVEARQTGKGTGYRLNGTHQLNSTLRLEWPKRTTQKHSADSISIVTAKQVGGSAGYKLNGKYRLNNTLRLQWPRRSMQKHGADSIGIVTAEQVGGSTGYRLNGTHQLNSTLRLEWPKRTTQKHSADSTNIVEARQVGGSAGYKLNGKYRLNNILRLEWPKRSMQIHQAESTNIVEASQTGKGTGYRLNSTHQLNNTLRLQWPRRSMQIHQAEISKIVVAEQSGNKTGYRLNSTHRLNNTLRLQWPRHSICAHSAIITIVRGNTKTVEVV